MVCRFLETIQRMFGFDLIISRSDRSSCLSFLLGFSAANQFVSTEDDWIRCKPFASNAEQD